MSLKVKATGNGAKADLRMVRRALETLADPEHGIQLQRSPFHAQSFATFPGSDIDSQVGWVERNQDATGIYYALNPVPLTLSHSLRVSDVVKRRWLLIDVDRDKSIAPDDSATDEEHEQAKQATWAISDYLTREGLPCPIVIDSGNGWHLVYRIDLPNSPLSREQIKAFLEAVAGKFSGPCKVGIECFDARRISKLPGTWARRGTLLPDRPWRMAKLAELPEVCEVLSPELIRDVTQRLTSPQSIETPAPWTTPETLVEPPKSLKVKATGDDLQAYAKAALDKELQELRATPAGNRNNQLNLAAFAIGQLIAANWSGLSRLDVESSLVDCALSIGLSGSETAGTIRSGIEAGMLQPRALPEGAASRNGKRTKKAHPSPSLDPSESITVCMADVMPKEIDWLIPNRIPRQFITIFAGRTGIGKSAVSLDIVARVTTGGEIPCSGGQRFTPGNVLLISEDSHEYVLAPRLLAADADMRRVRAMSWKAMGCYTLADTGMLTRAIAEFNDQISLIVIDPPTNFISDADEHKNSEVRKIVMAIVEWLQDKIGVAVVFITHVNKNCGKGVEALNRVMGSVAWVTTCRIAHSFSADPNDKERGLFLPMKTNLGPLGKGLAYKIVTRLGSAGVEWIGEVDTTADEAMAGTSSKPRKIVASEWLIERFREKREWESEDLFKAARAENISRDAIFEAKRILDLPRARPSTSLSGAKSFFWWVPDDWPQLTQEETPPTPVATVAPVETEPVEF
jgi:hypothetical protein